MKRYEFVAELQARTGDTNGQVVKPVQVNRWLNLAVRDIWKRWPWSFARKTSSVVTTAGTNTVNLAADLQRPKKVVNTKTLTVLRPRPERNLREWYPDATATSEPLYYSDGGLKQDSQTDKPTKKLLLFPTPDSAYTLEVVYLAKPTEMSNNQHYPSLPEEYDEAILQWCLIHYYRQLDDYAQVQDSEAAFREELNSLVSAFSTWQAEEYPVLMDSDYYNY